MSIPLHLSWHHGAGDTALFAPALKMWQDRGYEVTVDCSADKAPLFEAVGCETISDIRADGKKHFYWHPAVHPHPTMQDIHNGNKLAWNLTQAPMPNIGTVPELFEEYLGIRYTLKKQLTKKSKAEIDTWLSGVNGPLVLTHTQGNTSAGAKNFPGYLETEMYREILERTNATVLALDWDDRVNRFSSRRVRHLQDDFRKLSLPELWYIIDRSACLVGIDSGPLHLAEKWTDTACLGVWTGHHPSHFSVPSGRVAHLVTSIGQDRTTWNKYRRHNYNVISGGDKHTGKDIAVNVERMLSGQVGRELVLQNMLDKCNTAEEIDEDRHKSFRLVLDHLRSKAKPRMIETGCIRSEDDWTAGYSTYIFGMALHGHGELQSVDIDKGNCEFARKWTAEFDSVRVHQSDSLTWLATLTDKIDVVYLDSLDVNQTGHAEHCLKEAELSLPLMAEDGRILIDDTYWQRGSWVGKGKLAVPYLQSQGWKILYSGYQTLMGKV